MQFVCSLLHPGGHLRKQVGSKIYLGTLQSTVEFKQYFVNLAGIQQVTGHLLYIVKGRSKVCVFDFENTTGEKPSCG
jgi:hypothetical protein